MKKWIALGTTVVLGVLLGAWAMVAQETSRPPGMGPGVGMGMGMGRRGERGMRMGEFGRGGGRAIYRRALALLDNDRVKAALGLTDEQTSGLRSLAVETEKATVKTDADIEVKGIELRELLRADQPDSDSVIKKAEEISTLRGDLMKQHMEALLKAKSILRPEQQKKIRAFLEERSAGSGMAKRNPALTSQAPTARDRSGPP